MSKLILPFNKQKALAQLDGLIVVDKFAETNLIDLADLDVEVWDRDHELNYLTNPSDFYISSSDANDTQRVKILAITALKKLVSVTITLQGQTPVDISTGTSSCPDFYQGCKFLRAMRMAVFEGDVTAGNVYLASTTVGTVAGVPVDSAIQAWFAIAKQQTQMSHFTIPTDYWGLLTNLFVGIINEGNTSATNADVIIHAKDMDSSDFVRKLTLPVSGEGAVALQWDGRLFHPETDIHFNVLKVGRSSTKVAVNYTLELYNKDKIQNPILL